MRVLIVKTSSMGDVVHALPLAADIARARPGALIDWVCEDAFVPIPRMSPHVNEVRRVSLRRWRRQLLSPAMWREVARVRTKLRDARYDLVIDCQGLIKSALVGSWTRAPVVGYGKLTAREPLATRFYSRCFEVPVDLPAVQRCRELAAQALGYELEGPPRFELRPTGTPLADLGADSAVLLANTSRASKLWPEERWIELGRWLGERGLRSVLFWGAPEEGERVRRLAAAIPGARVAPRSGLDVLGASLAQAQLVVGVDTGLTHLAAALGRRCVGIFCDYPIERVGLTGDGPVESLGGVGQQPALEQVRAACERVLA
ncbi:MAG TPA: lipopolysaccharide heptosyltransferase I [Burkholderiaceae bacterium]|nr:lipopolysaccharide heptosyltransferase I [Burkholderiaceae bacterium]HPE02446.1 lipopolysaccharide heptosyltransferase I [Burkholderiaceae bacterium]HRZ00884.1 lipopolysaccharide heptosyltransferase I [Burkholderiaceae bacterium]